MQRLPYNGALRAHKLRHNVISSSLFNERWQRYVYTVQSTSSPLFPLNVTALAVPLSLRLPPLLLYRRVSLRPLRAATKYPHQHVPAELVASRALRCQVSQT